MNVLNQVLVFLHFFGLAMGFSVSFGNIVMGSLISKASPPDKAVLGRFPPALSRLSRSALVLLWATGLTLVYTRWGGFTVLPWQFQAKVGAVALLTLTSEYIHHLQGRAARGDLAAISRIETFAKLATVLAMTSLVFAVLTFE
jgi:hypothetical protein